MNIPKMDPSKAFRTLKSEVDHLFDRFVERPIGAAIGQVIPTLDIHETDNALIVRADLPGMDLPQIDVSVTETTLTLRGEKICDCAGDGTICHLHERSSGTFSRTISLPVAVKAEGVRADYRRGVLEITLPNKEQTQTRRVPITSADTPSSCGEGGCGCS